MQHTARMDSSVTDAATTRRTDLEYRRRLAGFPRVFRFVADVVFFVDFIAIHPFGARAYRYHPI